MVQGTSADEPDYGKRTSYPKMFTLGILVVLPNILAGMAESYSSIALPEMNLNTEMSAWFAASNGYAGFIGIMLVGFIIDAFGRKATLLLMLIPQIVGWALLYSDFSIFIAILGRALTGLSTVAMFYPLQLYAVECITVNHPRLRSNFRAWPGITNSLGVLLIFFTGTFFSYQVVSAFAAILSVIIFVLIYFTIPESPTWLYMKGRYGDAEISERKLGITQPILHADPESRNSPTPRVFSLSSSNMRQVAEKLLRPDVYRPAIVMTIVNILIIQTGGTVMSSYMLTVIGIDSSDVAASKSLAHQYSIISGLLTLAAHSLVSLTLPYLGCKKMTITMSFFMCIGLVTLGLTTGDANHINSYGIHVAALWIVIFSFHLGVLSVPTAVLSDLFPVDAKGFACIPVLMMSLYGAITVQLHPYLVSDFAGGVYYIYACACIVLAVFVFYFMPETVGRTYDQVRKYLLRSF